MLTVNQSSVENTNLQTGTEAPRMFKSRSTNRLPRPCGHPWPLPQPTTLEKCLQLRPWLLAKEDPTLPSWCLGLVCVQEAEHHPWEGIEARKPPVSSLNHCRSPRSHCLYSPS